MEWIQTVLHSTAWLAKNYVIVVALCLCVPAELKTSLSNFIEKETILDYDREAELALQRLTTGDVDVNQLTNAWTRSYVEVMTLDCYCT